MIGCFSMVILTLIIWAGYLASSQKNTTSQTPSFNGYELVDKTGNIRKPDDFRDHYQLLGTFMVLDPKGNEMHFTYASPGTAEYYRKTGKFADGVVLVKEIFFTDHAQLTTGDAHWSSRFPSISTYSSYPGAGGYAYHPFFRPLSFEIRFQRQPREILFVSSFRVDMAGHVDLFRRTLPGDAVGCGHIHQDNGVESFVLCESVSRHAVRMSIPVSI